jgi:glycosyltransferase involved in cell wall biosynthesis
LRIFYVTKAPFPNGMAPTNRIMSCARGCGEAGAEMTVVVLIPTETESAGIANREPSGISEEIRYVYSSGETVRSKSFVGRRVHDMWGFLNGLRFIWKEHSSRRVDALVMYAANSPLHILTFFILSRLLGITFLQDRNEFPHFLLKRTSILARPYEKLYASTMFRTFDGILVMTGVLWRYLEPRMRRSAKQLLVPMTVEPDRFLDSREPSPFHFPYVAYCGAPAGNKDGVPILIEAFSLIASKWTQFKLVIIGDHSNPAVRRSLEEFAERFGVSDRVVFTGTVPRTAMPAYLCHATTLALARPRSLQAEGGFPTKLGEYLVTGNPVVVTAVGEIPDYLKHKESAFIAEPDSARDFADTLDHVLSNPDEAAEVGDKGRQVALEHFNYRVQGANIVEFIQQLDRRKPV